MNQDIQKTLWAAADKLRSNMDAAEYKHVVLGLIFLKYISDAFDECGAELKAAFADPKHELYIGDDGQIPGFKLGGTWRFRRRDMDKWIPANLNNKDSGASG